MLKARARAAVKMVQKRSAAGGSRIRRQTRLGPDAHERFRRRNRFRVPGSERARSALPTGRRAASSASCASQIWWVGKTTRTDLVSAE